MTTTVRNSRRFKSEPEEAPKISKRKVKVEPEDLDTDTGLSPRKKRINRLLRVREPKHTQSNSKENADKERGSKSTSKDEKEKESDDQEVDKTEKKKKTTSRRTYHFDEVTGKKYYECPVCLKRLGGHLTTHMKIHNQEQPWSCKFCGKSFSQKCNLQTHLKTHEKSGDTIVTSPPKKKRKAKNSNKFPCDECDEAFETSEKLEAHMKYLHTYRRGEVYVCDSCDKVFKRKEYLDWHQLRYHIAREDHPEEEIDFKCEKCEYVFQKKETYENHVKEDKCTERAKREGKTILIECKECKRGFQTKFGLQRHFINVHGGSKDDIPYEEGSLPKFKCSKCEKVFETTHGMRRHFINNHANKKPYKCKKCKKTFNAPCFLKQHMVKHTGKRPYKCTECEATFKHKPSVSNHLKTVHGKEGEDVKEEYDEDLITESSGDENDNGSDPLASD